MEYIVFENGAYPKKLERQFFLFCALRQPLLFRFIFINIAANVAFYFKLISRQTYLTRRWYFLSKVNHLADARIGRFAEKNAKRVFIPGENVTILSEHPKIIVKKLCRRKVTANKYNFRQRDFSSFKNVCDMISEDEYTVYGTYDSPLMKKASVRKYITGKRVFETKGSYIRRLILRYALAVNIIFAASAAFSVLSLYFASASAADRWGLFRSYFSVGSLFLLNTLPITLLTLFLYLIFNRVSYACLASGLFTYILSLTNYFKIQFRNDPVRFEDIRNISEAANMTDRYTVTLTPKMIMAFAAFFAAAILLRLFLNDRIRIKFIRPAGVVLVALTIIFLFKNVYQSEAVYIGNTNTQYEKKYSLNDRFISKGFIYPLLYSSKDAVSAVPYDYDGPGINELMSKYKTEDIPEDKRINVIGIMLEAYGDFARFDELEFTVDPYEPIEDMIADSYTGELVDDIFAAGTVTTERQFLTGISDLPEFDQYTNSYAWYFREQGYKVNGGHPSHSWFYDRNEINLLLGFENYLYDDDYYFNKYGYHIADNYCLFDDVYSNFVRDTENGNNVFSFYVTYEGHGPYDDKIKYFENKFPNGLVKDKGYSKESLNILNNYFFLIYDTNKWLGNLADRLNALDTPVVLVLFGDHMPWLGNNNSVYEELGIDLDLETEKGFFNYYETPYFIWANDAAKKICDDTFKTDDPDAEKTGLTENGKMIGPYFLMSKVFDLLGWKGDDYMQYMRDVKDTFTAIHNTGAVICKDELTLNLDAKNKKYLNEINYVQFMRKNVFKYKKYVVE